MSQNQTQNRPKIAYRLQLEKRIQINKSYSERRNQATALRILSYGLFGQKRYQNLYLSCSLNCFFYALKIANTIHQKVPGLAMIVKFQTAHVIEYYSQPFQQKTFCQKNYSKIIIKLTKTPTEEDKKHPGFNAGLPVQQIAQPLTQVIIRNQRKATTNNNYYSRRNNNNNRNRYNNRNNNHYQKQYEQEQKRSQANKYRSNNYQSRYDNQNRSDQRRRTQDRDQKRKEYVPKKYGDDRDQRRIRRNRQEDLEQDDYHRGQRKTRGSYNNNRGSGYDRKFQKQNYSSKDYNREDKYKGTYQNKSRNRGDRGDRGDRGPQRRKEYNDDDDN